MSRLIKPEYKKLKRFSTEVVYPMDMLHGQEGLAFWSYWGNECKAYEWITGTVARKPRHSGKKISRSEVFHTWWLKPSKKQWEKYVNGTSTHARNWRNTYESMRTILQKCRLKYHTGDCYCNICCELYYIKGVPTMIIVRTKSVVYELRQFARFAPNAQQCLLDMLSQGDVPMYKCQCQALIRPATESVKYILLPPQKAMKKFVKYQYSQDVVESIILALED